jgi:hypothetical protein
MRIDRRIKVEGMGLDDSDDGVEACERKSNDEINAYRAEKCFRGGLFARKNAAEDNDNDENVESKTENDGDNGGRNRVPRARLQLNRTFLTVGRTFACLA